jgi:2-keto-4-pentenoate hydratase
MDDMQRLQAAELVAERRLARQRLGRLPDELAVRSLEDAYAVQGCANDILEERLGARVGHKIGGTTEAMRAYIAVPEPVGGEIFESTVRQSGAQVRLGDYTRPGIETEIAVRLAKPLASRPAPYTREEVADAVGSVFAAIEIVDDRYEDFRSIGAATIIADNAFNAASVLGDPVTDWRGLELDALTARTFVDRALMGEGTSDALYGHPLEALRWLANRLSGLGRGLEAGSFVSLGSITPVQWLDRPCHTRIEVEALGAVEVTFTS